MKNSILLSGIAALVALASSASAQVVVDITGATAFRTAAIDTIVASYGAGLLDFAHTGGAGGRSAARQSIFRGTFPGLGDTIIRCTWTGSVEGIQTVATQITQDFFATTALTTGGTAETVNGVIGTHSVPAGTLLVVPDLAFSDVYPTSSPYDVSNVVDANVGVVVFTMLANEGAPAAWTNVTAGQFRALFGAGRLPLNYFVPTSDTRNVYATGRSDFSGTRTTYLAETGFGIANTVQQWKPVLAAGNLSVSTLRLWPTNDGNNRSLVWGPDVLGNGGFESSSSLRTAFGATSASVQLLSSTGANQGIPVPLLLLSAPGISDATTAVANGAKALSYNGVSITPASPLSAGDVAKVTQGAYTLWGYQHLMYNTLNDTPEMQGVLAALTVNIGANVGTAGIDIALMNVSRNNDGGTVAP